MKTANIYFEGNLIDTVECTGADYVVRADSVLLFLANDQNVKVTVAVVPNNHLIVFEQVNHTLAIKGSDMINLLVPEMPSDRVENFYK